MPTFKGIVTADGQKRQLSYSDLVGTPKSDTTLAVKGGFADAEVTGRRFTENTVNIRNLEKQIGELSKGTGGATSSADIKKVIDEYLKENPENFLPDNIVLVEESDDEIMTVDKIMGEILAKLDLKAIDNQTLGLYIDTKLISSVKLEEFKTAEIICTGLALNPSTLTAYGKSTMGIVAKPSPPDCTQKVRWFTTDAEIATVSDGAVTTTGRKGSVVIYAICGNFRADCNVTIKAYVYPKFNFQLGEILETVGSAYNRTADEKKMRIASDYMKTPVDTIVTMTGGNSYLYQLYKYKDDKLDSFTSWISCTGTIEINSEEFSGFAIKIRRSNYGEWTDEMITEFSKTVMIANM